MSNTLNINTAKGQAQANKVMKISEWLKLSDKLSDWDGKQKSWIKSSNPKVKAYRKDSKDDRYITVNELRQLRQADEEAYHKLMSKGASYVYQRLLVTVKHNKGFRGSIEIDCYSDKDKSYLWSSKTTFSKTNLITVKDEAKDKNLMQVFRQFNK